MSDSDPGVLRAVCQLLGDSGKPGVTIPAWVAATTPSIHNTALDDEGSMVRDLDQMWLDRFGHACALLYHGRVIDAIELFQDIHLMVQGRPRLAFDGLARIGAAQAQALLKRHARAEGMFVRTLQVLQAGTCPIVEQLATCLRLSNLSDWGKKVSVLDLRPPVLPAHLPRAVATLIAAEQAWVHARVCQRAGQRERGLDLLDGVLLDPAFSELHPIVRGHVLRMKGILLDVSSYKPRARAMLEQAIDAYREAGYEQGEVQAALSLARVHEQIDPDETRRYLGRADEILAETDSPGQERRGGRQMIGEKAAILSRKAQQAFARGHIDSAIELCRQDLEMIKHLARDLPDGLPRQEATVQRHLGKMLLAYGRHAEAEKCFERSAEIFVAVEDPMARFFSLARRVTSLVVLERMEEASVEIALMREIIRECRTGEGQADKFQKEEAIVETFEAMLLWLVDRDGFTAQAILGRALHTLHRFGRDYYYARALALDGVILAGTGDGLGARHRLAEARQCALAVEAEDLRREIDVHLNSLGAGHSPTLEEKHRRLELTVLFADLRHFTRSTARMEPVKMAEFIRDFAERISRATTRHGGHPIRFLGDCVMAVFGLNHDDTAPKELRAVEAACEMDELFRNLRSMWAHATELEQVGIGFGLATGVVTVGRFGWKDLAEFSAIGAEVNLASRLQGCSRDGELHVCPVTYRRLQSRTPKLPFEEVPVELKGLEDARVAYRSQITRLVGSIGLPLARARSQAVH